MGNAKQQVESLLHKLPDNCSLEDIQYPFMSSTRFGGEWMTPASRGRSRRKTQRSGCANGSASSLVAACPCGRRVYCLVHRLGFPSYANAVVRRIVALTQTLSEFPLSGRKVPEFDDDSVRESIAYRYRIMYLVQPTEVLVAAVIHGKRML